MPCSVAVPNRPFSEIRKQIRAYARDVLRLPLDAI